MTFRKRTLINVPLTALLLIATTSSADTVVDDNLIVQDDLVVTNSLCVGLECADGEDFGEGAERSSVLLKDESPYIRFDDTSTSAQFPSNDWRMGLQGDANTNSLFVIEDLTGTGPVLQLGAEENSGVAIGFNSLLVPNAISVGTPGGERQVKFVAPGQDATDAANVAQFEAFTEERNETIDALETQAAEIAEQLQNLVDRLNALESQ